MDKTLREKRRAVAIQYVDHLLALAEASDISVPSAAAGKDKRATEAFRHLDSLAKVLAGWAMAHRMGLSLHGLARLPILHPGVRSLPDAMKAQAAVDDHRHERRGWEDRAGKELASSSKANGAKLRQHIVDYLSYAPGLDGFVKSALIEAFDALSVGVARPVFLASRHSRERERVRAIEFFEYRKGLGMVGEVATGIVADAYGVDDETIKKWRRDLRKSIGHRVTLESAKTAGKSELYLRSHPHLRDGSDDYEVHFGDSALHRDGASYGRLGTRDSN